MNVTDVEIELRELPQFRAFISCLSVFVAAVLLCIFCENDFYSSRALDPEIIALILLFIPSVSSISVFYILFLNETFLNSKLVFISVYLMLQILPFCFICIQRRLLEWCLIAKINENFDRAEFYSIVFRNGTIMLLLYVSVVIGLAVWLGQTESLNEDEESNLAFVILLVANYVTTQVYWFCLHNRKISFEIDDFVHIISYGLRPILFLALIFVVFGDFGKSIGTLAYSAFVTSLSIIPMLLFFVLMDTGRYGNSRGNKLLFKKNNRQQEGTVRENRKWKREQDCL